MVELRVFEELGGDKREDITFSYTANFFLFATLETARPIAHGRVQQAPAPALVPVLTGMPVSGMAYLDRPNEAGYFIFPDLSVRHEGKYKLSFNLYEQTKDKNDLDAEHSNEPKLSPPKGVAAPDSSFDWRLEIKSKEFQVYSAKKFPGLAESTALSRTVAEQGCRVRIRRDVRMRRRDGKGGPDFDDNYEDERVAQTAEQDYRARSRSHSDSANGEDGRAQYPSSPFYTPTPTPSSGTAHGGHLQFGSFGSNSNQQYQAPRFAQPPPPPAPYQPPPPPPNSYQPGPPQYHGPATPQSNYDYPRPYPQSAFPTDPPREPRYDQDQYNRRASVPAGYPPPLPQPQPRQPPYPTADPVYSRPYDYSHVSNSEPAQLAPLKTILEPNYQPRESLSSPPGPLSSSINRFPPTLPGPSNLERPRERQASYSDRVAPYGDRIPPSYAERIAPYEGQPGSYKGYPSLHSLSSDESRKRSFGTVFPAVARDQPLYNGMRPTSLNHSPGGYNDEDNELTQEEMDMEYKRASGHTNVRRLPEQSS